MIEIMNTVSAWAIPVLVVVVVAYAAWKRVPVFETFVEGGKEGFAIAVDLIPYMVAILVGLGIFRESGAFDILAKLLNPLTSLLGIPGEVLPLAIMRPISGNGALAIAAETMQRYGPDSLLGLIACTMQGSTDTTFYILTVYFGSVGVRNVRYSLKTGLLADITGFLVSVYVCKLVFG